MRKIGILTFHTADNYGAVLQAYALQNFITEHLNHDAEVINFSTPLLENEYGIMCLGSKNPVKNIVLKFINLLYYTELKRKKDRFNSFRNDLIKLSDRKYVSSDDLKNKIYPYDVFISGSDQVFNPDINYSDIYYLNFHKGRGIKVAYAPSFGISDFTSEISDRIKPWLDDFDSLSCREEIGAKYLSQLMNTRIPCVIDPVFLLEKEDWLKIAIPPKTQYKYLFVYDLNGGEKLLEIACKIAAEKKLKVVCCTAKIQKRYKGVKCVYDLGPLELLGYIANASFVVTDSFHGTSLSVILESEFVSYIATQKTASRITSLLNSIGLKDRIVCNQDIANMNCIDTFAYKRTLNKLRSFSIEFLQNAIDL